MKEKIHIQYKEQISLMNHRNTIIFKQKHTEEATTCTDTYAKQTWNNFLLLIIITKTVIAYLDINIFIIGKTQKVIIMY